MHHTTCSRAKKGSPEAQLGQTARAFYHAAIDRQPGTLPKMVYLFTLSPSSSHLISAWEAAWALTQPSLTNGATCTLTREHPIMAATMHELPQHHCAISWCTTLRSSWRAAQTRVEDDMTLRRATTSRQCTQITGQ